MLTVVEKVLALRRIALFEGIPSEELSRVARLSREVVFEPGDPLMRAGEHGDCMFVVLEGAVRVLKDDREVARLAEGAVVGEMAILDSEPRSATVEAFDTVRVLRLDREAFTDLLQERPEIAVAVIRMLTRRLRGLLDARTSSAAVSAATTAPSAPAPRLPEAPDPAAPIGAAVPLTEQRVRFDDDPLPLPAEPLPQRAANEADFSDVIAGAGEPTKR